MEELILGFLMGIIPSAVSFLYRIIIKKRRLNKLIKMHDEAYIKPLYNLIRDILDRSPLNSSESIKMTSKIIKDTNAFIYEIEYFPMLARWK